MTFAPLVEVTRGNDTESIHFGSIAVVNVKGELLYQAGDPHFLTFTRSALKPLQAVPFMQTGGPAHFGFSPDHVALMCASHSGEEMHTERVRAILQAIGCDEHHLQCGCHEPFYFSYLKSRPDPGMKFTPVHHNCSGKHAGFLAYCVQHGLPLDSYLEPAHPLQQAIKESVAYFTGLQESSLKSGIDGCSAPNLAMPLSSLALVYAKLAQGAADARYGTALGELCDAMIAYPELVSGTERNDLALMQAGKGDWVAKAGAEGVQAVGIRSAGIGIALKVADGHSRAAYPATVSVLEQLGLIEDIAASPLAKWFKPDIRNLNERLTGQIRPVVELRPC